MKDTQMELGTKRQGHPSSGWEDKEASEFNLPTSIQMGEEYAFKRDNNEAVVSEMTWYDELARILIKAFQPASYCAAMKAIRVIVQNGTPAVSRRLRGLVNPLGLGECGPLLGAFLMVLSNILRGNLTAGRHTSFGTQVDHHRDGNNATLFASANFFGEHYGGGELILNYLGYAVYGGHGYSVHAALDILVHGVGTITRLPNVSGHPPQRISMAIYSHASIFAGSARFSGMNQTPKIFSDPSIWIPFYPPNFSHSDTCAALKAEEKRLHEKYRNEVRRYQGAL